MHSIARFASVLLSAWLASPALADLPEGFIDEQVLTDLDSPAGFAFAPDGRLFYSERINGRLRVASYDADADAWTIDPQPYYQFATPVDADGNPRRVRSAGLRGFTFDPDFQSNGHIYAIYMANNPQHNRLVRITQDPADPTRALPGSERLLLDLPYNSSQSSGSHNGAAVRFGADGMLYASTGDGWNGGDGVQSLSTATGKLFRVAPDGTIPTDNPFYSQASGDNRAIFALGLRNPFSMSLNPASGNLYVHDASGGDKTDILLVRPSANYGHQGYSGIGIDSPVWHNAEVENTGADKLITGGAWYPADGPFPPEYHGGLFVCHWGSNNAPTGVINFVRGEDDKTTTRFASNVAKPVCVQVGPDGSLYYMYTTYQTYEARIHRIKYTAQPAAATPLIDPAGGTHIGSVTVTLSTATDPAQVRFTLDGSNPTESSQLYTEPLVLTQPGTLRARAFPADPEAALAPSGVAEAFFNICPDASCNEPPIARAGNDKTVVVGEQTFISGSASSDGDTDEALLSDGWRQTEGPRVELLNDDETVAYFTPTVPGWYRFEYSISDGLASDTDEIDVFAVPCLDQPLIADEALIVRYSFDEIGGSLAIDDGSGAYHAIIDDASRTPARSLDAGAAVAFDGRDDAIDLPQIDVDAPAFSVAAWIRVDAFDTPDARIISKADGVRADDHLWMLSTINAGGAHALRFRLDTITDGTTTLIANTALPAARWVHVAAIYDGARMRIYQDGQPVGSVESTGRVSTNPAVPVTIGNQPDRSRPFNGAIDELLILDRALSAAEITMIASPYRPFDISRDGLADAEDVALFGSQPVDFNNDGIADEDDLQCLVAFVNRAELVGMPQPCGPADFADTDGLWHTLDFNDIERFVIEFLGDSPLADLTRDGRLDIFDIEIFFSAFLTGCP